MHTFRVSMVSRPCVSSSDTVGFVASSSGAASAAHDPSNSGADIAGSDFYGMPLSFAGTSYVSCYRLKRYIRYTATMQLSTTTIEDPRHPSTQDHTPSRMSTAKETVDKAIANETVLIFGKSWCSVSFSHLAEFSK
jgi:hypothetical protein